MLLRGPPSVLDYYEEGKGFVCPYYQFRLLFAKSAIVIIRELAGCSKLFIKIVQKNLNKMFNKSDRPWSDMGQRTGKKSMYIHAFISFSGICVALLRGLPFVKYFYVARLSSF